MTTADTTTTTTVPNYTNPDAVRVLHFERYKNGRGAKCGSQRVYKEHGAPDKIVFQQLAAKLIFAGNNPALQVLVWEPGGRMFDRFATLGDLAHVQTAAEKAAWATIMGSVANPDGTLARVEDILAGQ